MSNLSDNYYGREYFFKTDQAPTFSLISHMMGKSLANVYFNSMSYEHKVVAGLEPPLKGGGMDWYVPPKEVLKGRAVLKPEKKEHLAHIGSKGIIDYGEHLLKRFFQNRERENQQRLIDTENNWKQTIDEACQQQFNDKAEEAKERNTKAIQAAFNEFTMMCTTSLTKIEHLLFDASMKEIKRMKNEAHSKLQNVLKERLEVQAKKLYKKYADLFNIKKDRRKNKFLRKVEEARDLMAAEIHDIEMERHRIVEKLRHYLQTQNLACQVYIALKEREECIEEMDRMKHEHKRKIKLVKEQLAMTDFEISLAWEKEKKRQEFNRIWKKKVCEVVKRLQMFVTFCLASLPEYADFFIDMEKLMLLHLNAAFENPKAESIFEEDKQEFHSPVPKPHPFYLVCDKGYKPNVEENLCPKHCTSSASQMPVVVVNKRCIYASCDNFQEFTSKITDFIHGRQGDDIDFEDQHNYEMDVPVKYTSKEQLQELQLESSLLQIIQKERPNLHSLNLQCCSCAVPHCFCEDAKAEGGSKAVSLGVSNRATEDGGTSKGRSKDKDTMSISSAKSAQPSVKTRISVESFDSGNKVTHDDELVHEREPKIGGYLKYIMPMKCKCFKTAKKHVAQNLPPYMTIMSKYDELELPNYEKCPVGTLKKLVKEAQGKPQQIPPPEEVTPTHRDIATQYSDPLFDRLCTCFSDDGLQKFLKELEKDNITETARFKTVDGDITPSMQTRPATSFATKCAQELKKVLQDSPELLEIFKKKDCKFD